MCLKTKTGFRKLTREGCRQGGRNCVPPDHSDYKILCDISQLTSLQEPVLQIQNVYYPLFP